MPCSSSSAIDAVFSQSMTRYSFRLNKFGSVQQIIYFNNNLVARASFPNLSPNISKETRGQTSSIRDVNPSCYAHSLSKSPNCSEIDWALKIMNILY